MFYVCSMPSETDSAAQRLLSELAELSLGMARKLEAAAQATHHASELSRLATAFCGVARCVRLSIALAARLARGEPLAPAARETRDLEAEADQPDETEVLEDRPERL